MKNVNNGTYNAMLFWWHTLATINQKTLYYVMTGLYLVRLMYILCSFYFRYVGSAKPGILGICNYSQNFRIFIWKVYYVLKIFHGTFFLNQFIFKNNCSLESVSIYYYLNIMRNKRNETSVFIHVLIQYKITTTHWSGAVQFYFMIWGRK